MLTVEGRPTWRTILGGSKTSLEPLCASFRDRIRLATAVRRIRRTPTAVRLGTADGDEATFDHVVLACHSDQALALLEDPTPAEDEILGAIRYQPNDVVLHTDTTLLPRKRVAWASWNYRLTEGGEGASTVTYDMNILQGLDAPVEFCVSLNQNADIDPSQVIRTLRYEHPIFDIAAERARQRRSELLNTNRTSFCGAYWGYGFHEDGVRSAHEVGRALAGSAVT
jgi:predicted NAD/FAD-binding protein